MHGVDVTILSSSVHYNETIKRFFISISFFSLVSPDIELHSHFSNRSRFLLHESKILDSLNMQSLVSIFEYAICIMEVNPLCWPTSTKCMHQKSCFRQNGWLIQCTRNFFRYSYIPVFQKLIHGWTVRETKLQLSRKAQHTYYRSVTPMPRGKGKNWMDKAFIS